MVAKVTHTFAISCLLMLFNSITTTPGKAQLPQNNSPSLGLLGRVPDIQPPTKTQSTPPSPAPQLPPPSQLLQPVQGLPTLEQPFPEIPYTFTVKQFEVVGSTVFSQKKLNEVLKDFINKPITFAQLLEARSKITELYNQKGYITSEAYIPEQTFTDGVVRIQVIEGKLEDIQVTGTRRLNPNYIRSRIANGASTPLNQKRLLQSLQLLQLNPLIKSLSAELFAGSRTDTSLLAIKVTEADTFNTKIVLDNRPPPDSGSFRRQLQVKESNLLGIGDSISLTYSNTDGSNAIDASYSLPLNPHNGTLTFRYGNRPANFIERPFDILDIESTSQRYELTFRQPLLQTPNQEFALGLTGSYRESEATLLGGEIPFPSPGDDAQGRTRVSALRFFQEWISRNSQEVIAARSQFSLGIDAFNVTINDTGPDSRFFAWRGQAQWVRLLAPDTVLLIRGDVQLASTTLLASEKFRLGGVNSVRRFRQDLLVGDNGALASAELRLPILRVRSWKGVLQVTPFVDVGTAWSNSSNRDENNIINININTNTLAAVGLGLRWLQGNNFTAAVEWGIPLVSVDTSHNTWQENGLYFFVQYNLF